MKTFSLSRLTSLGQSNLRKRVELMKSTTKLDFSLVKTKKQEFKDITTDVPKDKIPMVLKDWNISHENEVKLASDRYMQKYIPSLETVGTVTALSIGASFLSFAPEFDYNIGEFFVNSFLILSPGGYFFQQMERKDRLEKTLESLAAVNHISNVYGDSPKKQLDN